MTDELALVKKRGQNYLLSICCKHVSAYNMPRPLRLRILLLNTPHHIDQRGQNQHTVFVRDEECNSDRGTLIHLKNEYGRRIYTFCRMTNPLHLVIDPGDVPESLSKIMKRVAGRQTRY